MNEHDDELQVAGNYEWRWRNKKTTMRMTEKKKTTFWMSLPAIHRDKICNLKDQSKLLCTDKLLLWYNHQSKLTMEKKHYFNLNQCNKDWVITFTHM